MRVWAFVEKWGNRILIGTGLIGLVSLAWVAGQKGVQALVVPSGELLAFTIGAWALVAMSAAVAIAVWFRGRPHGAEAPHARSLVPTEIVRRTNESWTEMRASLLRYKDLERKMLEILRRTQGERALGVRSVTEVWLGSVFVSEFMERTSQPFSAEDRRDRQHIESLYAWGVVDLIRLHTAVDQVVRSPLNQGLLTEWESIDRTYLPFREEVDTVQRRHSVRLEGLPEHEP